MNKHCLLIALSSLVLMVQPIFAQHDTSAISKIWLLGTVNCSFSSRAMFESPYGQTVGEEVKGGGMGFHILFPMRSHFHIGALLQFDCRNTTVDFEGTTYSPSTDAKYLGLEAAYTATISSRHSLTALAGMGYRNGKMYDYPCMAIPVDDEDCGYANLSLLYTYRLSEKWGLGLQGQTFLYPKSSFAMSADPLFDTWALSLAVTYYPSLREPFRSTFY